MKCAILAINFLVAYYFLCYGTIDGPGVFTPWICLILAVFYIIIYHNKEVIMSKSPQMEKMLEDLSKKAFGNSRKQNMNAKKCVWCNKPVEGFRDALSRKEYRISGFCQSCQDKTFQDF